MVEKLAGEVIFPNYRQLERVMSGVWRRGEGAMVLNVSLKRFTQQTARSCERKKEKKKKQVKFSKNIKQQQKK